MRWLLVCHCRDPDLSPDSGSLWGIYRSSSGRVVASVCVRRAVKQSFEKPVRIHLQSARVRVKGQSKDEEDPQRSTPRPEVTAEERLQGGGT